MMENSTMTTERGLAENLCLSIKKSVERETGRKSCVNIWHKIRNNAWSVGIYVYVDSASKKREPVCTHGEGWDLVDAITNLRDNFLKEKSEEYQSPFTNLLEFDMFIDRRDNVERNDVGAVVDPNYEVKKDASLEAIIEQLNELSKAISKISK